MEKTTLFTKNRHQIICLPENVAMPKHVKRVDIIAIGRARIITPAGATWDSWFDGDNVSADFMTAREQ